MKSLGMIVVFALGALWTLSVTMFMVLACGLFQIAALLTGCFVGVMTGKWQCHNLLEEVAFPRAANMWRDYADMLHRHSADQVTI